MSTRVLLAFPACAALLLAACSGGSSTANVDAAALTEGDFVADPGAALDAGQVGVTFLEPTDAVNPGSDTGTVGVDVIPIRVATRQASAFELDPAGLGTVASVEIRDAQGNSLLLLQSGNPSGVVVLEPGLYKVEVRSAFLADEEVDGNARAVFLIPEAQAGVSPSARSRGQLDATAFKRTVRVGYCPGCDLTGANLVSANLSNARLTRANLTGAKLGGARLNGASLDGARLTRAELPEARLFGANLLKADLAGADLTKADLGLATWVDGAVCKEGSIGQCLPRTPTTAAWTIFVYGHGDHDLTAPLVYDVYRMGLGSLATPDGSGVNVLVATDLCAGNRCANNGVATPFENYWDGDKVNYVPRTGTTFWRITGDGKPPVEVGRLEEQNFDDPAVMQRWIALTFKAYPANHYAVIFWDHGGSWDGGYGGDQQDQAKGWKENLSLQATTVASTLGAALKEAGLGDRKLDLVAFDTCLMATSEVIWNFKDLAQVFVANAELDFGLGLAYHSTLPRIAANPDAPVLDIARGEVADWTAWQATPDASNPRTNELLLRAHAAFDLAKLDAYRDSVRWLVDTMLRSARLDWAEVARSRTDSHPQYGSLSSELTSDYYDFGQFLTKLGAIQSDPDVAFEARSTRAALEAMTIERSMGSVREAAGQLGLHTALDTARSWQWRGSAYAQLPWNAQVRWSLVLDVLARENKPWVDLDSRVGPGFSAEYGWVSGVGSVLSVQPTTSAVDVATARVYLQVPYGEKNRLRGLVDQKYASGSGRIDVPWKGETSFLVNVDGKTRSPVHDETLVKDLVNGKERSFRRFPIYRYGSDGKLFTEADGETAKLAYAVVDSATGEVAFLLQKGAAGFSFTSVATLPDGWIAPVLPSFDEKKGEITFLAPEIGQRFQVRGKQVTVSKAIVPGAVLATLAGQKIDVVAEKPSFLTFLGNVWGTQTYGVTPLLPSPALPAP